MGTVTVGTVTVLSFGCHARTMHARACILLFRRTRWLGAPLTPSDVSLIFLFVIEIFASVNRSHAEVVSST